MPEPDMILLEAEESMKDRAKMLKKELSKVRTGRANPSMLEDVMVDYYGVDTPISQVGQITVPEATQLVVKPYDKSMVEKVEKAINKANLGINPNNEGELLRIILPAPTKERRQLLTKDVHRLGEECKIAIRNIRRDANADIKKLENNHDISEDASEGYQEDIQELTDKYTEYSDKLVQEKDQEITKF
ncbi:MAG: ribosome recycling factor [Candidatus Izimaplasma sp.]|nr:ribosome recycling factor [Candidatus Izimaplasma bacterium]